MKAKIAFTVFASITIFILLIAILSTYAEAKPEIKSITPEKITKGDEVTISGHFVGKEKDPKKSEIEVRID